MKNNFLEHRPQLRGVIRYTEIIVVLVLLVFAIRTYRELRTLRAAPVILPSYWFNAAASSGEQAGRVQARGSWVSKQGSPEFLHTTTIECIKSKMHCVESSAVVSLSEGGFLESVQTIFEIETWNDTEIITKRETQPCASRMLILDMANRQAQSLVTPVAGAKSCKNAATGEQTYTLVTGQAAHAAATGKSK